MHRAIAVIVAFATEAARAADVPLRQLATADVYGVSVSIGTPAQNFTLLLSIDQPMLWVPSKHCRNCNFLKVAPYDHNASTSFAEDGRNFTDAVTCVIDNIDSVQGFWSTDDVSVMGSDAMTAAQLSIGETTEARFIDFTQGWDGVLGLGRGGMAPLVDRLELSLDDVISKDWKKQPAPGRPAEKPAKKGTGKGKGGGRALLALGNDKGGGGGAKSRGKGKARAKVGAGKRSALVTSMVRKAQGGGKGSKGKGKGERVSRAANRKVIKNTLKKARVEKGAGRAAGGRLAKGMGRASAGKGVAARTLASWTNKEAKGKGRKGDSWGGKASRNGSLKRSLADKGAGRVLNGRSAKGGGRQSAGKGLAARALASWTRKESKGKGRKADSWGGKAEGRGGKGNKGMLASGKGGRRKQDVWGGKDSWGGGKGGAGKGGGGKSGRAQGKGGNKEADRMRQEARARGKSSAEKLVLRSLKGGKGGGKSAGGGRRQQDGPPNLGRSRMYADMKDDEDQRLMKKIKIVAQLDQVPRGPNVLQQSVKRRRTSGGGGRGDGPLRFGGR